MRVVAQPGHWLGPVTGLGRLGLVQPQKIKKIKKIIKRGEIEI